MSYIKARYVVIKYKLKGFDADVDAHWTEFRRREDEMLQGMPVPRWLGDDLVYELVRDFETEEDGGDTVFNLTVELHDSQRLGWVVEDMLSYLTAAFSDRLIVHDKVLETERIVLERSKIEL